MFDSIKNVFKVKEIRMKLLFTFLMMIVIRFGCQLPVPGVDRNYFADWFAQQTGDAFSFVDAFTGGSFLNMSILALNITPYITSSIIIQLLTIAIPKLEELQKELDCIDAFRFLFTSPAFIKEKWLEVLLLGSKANIAILSFNKSSVNSSRKSSECVLIKHCLNSWPQSISMANCFCHAGCRFISSSSTASKDME